MLNKLSNYCCQLHFQQLNSHNSYPIFPFPSAYEAIGSPSLGKSVGKLVVSLAINSWIIKAR
jgi:hypothetical protein